MQFWKPGTTAPGSSLDRASESEGALLQSAPQSTAFISLQEQRERLPIFKYSRHLSEPLSRAPSELAFATEKELLYAVETYGVTIVVAETGSGKTTRMMLSLVDQQDVF